MPTPPAPSPVAGDDDVALLGQVADGDLGEPLTVLYRRYAGPLYGYGQRVLRDDGLAEELVQEVFVRLWRTAGRYSPARGSVRTYLYMLARTISVDLLRRPSSRPYDSLAETVAAAESADGTDHDQLLDRLTVRDALDSLTPAHRQVLTLVAQGCSQTLIAAKLGIPVGTVKSRMFWGLRALRVALHHRGIHA